MVKVGEKVPDITLPATGGKEIKLSDFHGQNLILYFYPKDNTAGCTTEGQNFRDAYEEFKNHNTEILGVSRDSVKSHESFCSKYSFPFELLSDQDEVLCKAFDVIKEKSMYGRTFMGVVRSTFVIDKEGTLVKEYRKVSVKDHADELLEFVKSM